MIESGYRNSTFHLYRWNELINQTGKAECIDRCAGELILNQQSENISALEAVFNPCLTKFSSNYPLKTENRSQASPLFFAGTGQLRLLALKSPKQAEKLIQDISTYLKNRTNFNVRDVSVLDESKEGLYSWVAGNVHQLESASNTSAGSSDVVLELNDVTSVIAWNVNKSRNDSVNNDGVESNVQLFGRNYTIKSASDMCFGSDLAKYRLTILLIKDNLSSNSTTPIDDPCLPINSTRTVDTDDLISNDCLELKSTKLPPGKKYLLTGKGNAENCSDRVREILDADKCASTFVKCLSKSHLISPKDAVIHPMSDYLLAMAVLNYSDHSIVDTDYFNQTHFTCKLSAEQLKAKVPAEKADEMCFRLSYNYWMIKEVHQVAGNWSNFVWNRALKSRWPLGVAVNASTTMSGEGLHKFDYPFFRSILCWVVIPVCFVASVYFLVRGFKLYHEMKQKYYEALQQQAM